MYSRLSVQESQGGLAIGLTAALRPTMARDAAKKEGSVRRMVT